MKTRSGFSLIEVILALGLGALLLVFAVRGVGWFVDALLDARDQPRRTALAPLDSLYRDLENALALDEDWLEISGESREGAVVLRRVALFLPDEVGIVLHRWRGAGEATSWSRTVWQGSNAEEVRFRLTALEGVTIPVTDEIPSPEIIAELVDPTGSRLPLATTSLSFPLPPEQFLRLAAGEEVRLVHR